MATYRKTREEGRTRQGAAHARRDDEREGGMQNEAAAAPQVVVAVRLIGSDRVLSMQAGQRACAVRGWKGCVIGGVHLMLCGGSMCFVLDS